MGIIQSCTSTVGKMLSNQKVANLPSSASAPYEILFRLPNNSLNRVAQISIRVLATCQFTVAVDQAEALTRFANGDYDILDTGRTNLPVVGIQAKNLYVRSLAGGVNNGLSYTLIEGDTT